jgi:hypothetical protein
LNWLQTTNGRPYEVSHSEHSEESFFSIPRLYLGMTQVEVLSAFLHFAFKNHSVKAITQGKKALG